MTPELSMSFADTAALAQEIAQNLKHGRSFMRDAGGIPVLSDCTLVLVHPHGGELRLSAQVVMVLDQGAMRGIGLELRPFNAEVASALDAFVTNPPPAPLQLIPEEPYADERVADEASSDELIPVGPYAEGFEDDEPLDMDAPLATADQEGDAPTGDLALEQDASDDEDGDDEDDGDEDGDDEDGDGDQGTSGSVRAPDVQQRAHHERMRKLSAADQQKIARGGELADRVMLERLYGKQVWDGLLRNPKLTVPEVARMARKGTMPRPMLELIVDNASWMQAGAVRRALLTNPRVAGEAVMKILRLTPKHELKAITKGTAYSTLVRDAARKLLKL